MAEQVNLCRSSGKRCYSQREAALLSKRGRNIRRYRGVNHKTPVRYYFCQDCGTYHLTSGENGRRYKGYRPGRKNKRR